MRQAAVYARLVSILSADKLAVFYPVNELSYSGGNAYEHARYSTVYREYKNCENNENKYSAEREWRHREQIRCKYKAEDKS